MITVVLFLNNYRMDDNYVFEQACNLECPILPVAPYNSDRHQKSWFGWPSMGPYRQQFLHECLHDLEHQLNQINLKLWITSGRLVQVIKIIHQQYKNIQVIFPRQLGQYESEERAELQQYCSENNIKNECIWDWTLIQEFELSRLPLGFSGFRKKVEKQLNVPYPIQIKDHITGVDHNFVNQFVKLSPNKLKLTFQGGELAAKKHMNDYIWTSKAVKHYKKTRNKLIGQHFSSKFSLYLSLGCLSARTIYHEVKRFEKEYGKNDSTYWLIFELLWRDFFQFQYLKNESHWFQYGGIQQKSWAAPNIDKLSVESWVNGQTQSDFVNANMIELKKTGYMSNRGRQNAASYLIYDLGQDWRYGAAVFEHYLIDYDVASNIGNWMYIAGVGNSRQARMFNVEQQQNRYDANGSYTKYWLNQK
tara:strand:- start:101 stop:1354 length:1254 start_codon:yes stop_codon:yes gene_type:complete